MNLKAMNSKADSDKNTLTKLTYTKTVANQDNFEEKDGDSWLQISPKLHFFSNYFNMLLSDK